MQDFLTLFGKDITFFGAICSILGIVGTALGIINAWISIRNEKIKIKLSLGFSFVVENIQLTCTNPFKQLNEEILNASKIGLPIYPNFKIINKSKFDLYVEEIGLTDSKSKKQSAIFIKDMKNMPRELKSFSSSNFPCTSYIATKMGDDWKYAYITLSTGKTFFQKLPHYKKTINSLKDE